MSNLVNYSRFGTTLNNTDTEALRGEAGFGFAVDEFGNYDIQNNNFVNVDDIELNTITPATSNIIINGDLDMNNNNILNVNNLDTFTLNIEGSISSNTGSVVINDDLSLSNNNISAVQKINTNEISTTNTNIIQFNDDLLMVNSKRIKITDDLTSTMSTFPGGLHIQNNTSSQLWLESDSDVTGTNNDPIIHLSSRGNEVYSIIRTRFSGGFGDLQYLATQVGADVCRHMFYTGLSNNTAKNVLPSILSQTLRFQIAPTLISCYRNFDMTNNNILNCTDVETQTLTATNGLAININDNMNMQANNITNINELGTSTITSISGAGGSVSYLSDLNMVNNNILDVNQFRFQTVPTLDNTETRLLCLNTGDNVIEYRQASTILNNPFNQSLNTTNSPTFDGLTINSNADFTQGNLNNVLQINNTTSDITVSPLSNVIMGPNKNIAFQNAWLSMNNSVVTPPVASGFNSYIYKNGTDLFYKNSVATFQLSRNFYYQFAESLGQSTNAGAFVSKVTLTTSSIIAGTYEVEYYCLVANSSNAEITELRVQENGITLDGVTMDKPFMNTIAPPRKFTTMSNKYVRVLSAGVYTYTLDYQALAGSGTTAYIRDARIIFKFIQ